MTDDRGFSSDEEPLSVEDFMHHIPTPTNTTPPASSQSLQPRSIVITRSFDSDECSVEATTSWLRSAAHELARLLIRDASLFNRLPQTMSLSMRLEGEREHSEAKAKLSAMPPLEGIVSLSL
jgi:hypothetical protein